jgi:hypothetical protein
MAFIEWLRQAREDFGRAASLVSRQMITERSREELGPLMQSGHEYERESVLRAC